VGICFDLKLETIALLLRKDINYVKLRWKYFFKLYPTASQNELAYYVKGNVLKAVGENYVFEELIDPYTRKKEKK